MENAVTLDQLVVQWMPRDQVRPNQYNPNRMTMYDRELLKTSILEDGWTQPIVVLPDMTIVDGEQRWTVAGMSVTAEELGAILRTQEEREHAGYAASDSIRERLESALATVQALGGTATIAALTGGQVPVTVLSTSDEAHKMISTIRHNKARGSHDPDKMGELTITLREMGLDADDFEMRLGISHEEARRLLDNAQAEEFRGRFTTTEQAIATLGLSPGDPAAQELARQTVMQAQARALAEQAAMREFQIKQAVEHQMAAHPHPELVTQEDRQAIRQQAEAQFAPVPGMAVDLVRLSFFTTNEERYLIQSIEQRLGLTPVECLLQLFYRQAVACALCTPEEALAHGG